MAIAKIEISGIDQHWHVAGGSEEQVGATVLFSILPAGAKPDQAIVDQRAEIKLTPGALFGEDTVETSFPGLRFPLHRQELGHLIRQYYVGVMRGFGIEPGTPNKEVRLRMLNNWIGSSHGGAVTYDPDGSAGW